MTLVRAAYSIFSNKVYLTYIIIEDFSLSRNDFEDLVKNTKSRLPLSTAVLYIKPHIVFSPKILALAFYYALEAFRLKVNISKYIDLETLLYLHGSRQISSVIENIVWSDEPQMFICCCSVLEENLSYIYLPLKTISPRKTCTELKPDYKKILSIYSISMKELDSVKGESLEEKLFKLVAFRMSLFFAENSRKTTFSSNLNQRKYVIRSQDTYSS
ncbi:MAG: hypothetical protein DRN04_09560 [Thermoprotei archaeon]|nr:MAG: hypothetical protein DRN04_09560 [Thermoprotei archaeon]